MKRLARSNVCSSCFVVLGLFLAEAALCAPPHDPEMVKYVNDAIDIMEKHSIYRNRISWPDFRELLFERIDELTEPSHAHEVVQNALLSIGDTHAGLIDPEYFDAIQNDGVESSNLPPWSPVEAGLIGNRIAYVTIPSFVGRNPDRVSAYIDEIHDAIESVDSKDVCGWIVDLRRTSEGNIWAMLAGIGPVLGSGEAGGQIGPDGRIHVRIIENGRIAQAEPSGRAYRLKNRNPPVAVLIGHETSGPGEATALAFIGREMSLTFGEATAGMTTGRYPFQLSDGYRMNMARSILSDRIHRPFFGSIEPQNRATENDVVNVAAKWLGFSDPCQ